MEPRRGAEKTLPSLKSSFEDVGVIFSPLSVAAILQLPLSAAETLCMLCNLALCLCVGSLHLLQFPKTSNWPKSDCEDEKLCLSV